MHRTSSWPTLKDGKLGVCNWISSLQLLSANFCTHLLQNRKTGHNQCIAQLIFLVWAKWPWDEQRNQNHKNRSLYKVYFACSKNNGVTKVKEEDFEVKFNWGGKNAKKKVNSWKMLYNKKIKWAVWLCTAKIESPCRSKIFFLAFCSSKKLGSHSMWIICSWTITQYVLWL